MKKKVLIVGGYGTVGSVVSEILAQHEDIQPVISGRNESKARDLAGKLQAEWRFIDVNDKEAISSALADISVVINCFSGPFTHFNLLLPELSSTQGIHYIDVAGSYEYAERFLKMNELASKNKSILITSLGVNPGIPGIALLSGRDEFDKLESGKIYFIMGSKFDGISVSSLKELKHMFDVKPLVWHVPLWTDPKGRGLKEYVGKPFDKDIYLGGFLTRDLIVLPELTGVNELSFWSGSQSTFQGLLMIIGLKLGLTRSDRAAQVLLNLLKKVGKTKNSIPDVFIKIEMIGKKEGARQQRIIEMYCEENYATALAPVIVCQLIIEGKITRYGAFVPPEIVPAKDFMEQLGKYKIHFSTTIKAV